MSLRSVHPAAISPDLGDDPAPVPHLVGLASGTFEAPTEIIRDVLVVEPDPDAQTALSRALALPGRRIIGTSSSEGAYAFLRENPPDAIFVADKHVGMDPLDFCAHLRELCPGSLIVWMTESETGASASLRHGVDLELSHDEILDLPAGTLEYLRYTSRRDGGESA